MEGPQQISFAQSQKRAFEDDVEPSVSTPKNELAAPFDTDSPLSSAPSLSPMRIASSQTLPPASSANSINTPALTASSVPQQAAKRRKYTEKEKAEMQLEKDAKKAQREEEKRIKDEEKRRKLEEREEKKRAKETEQQQKEEEKRKKERSQMRLNNFFMTKKTDGQNSGNMPADANRQTTPDILSSAPDIPTQVANSGPVSPQKALKQKATNDYDRFFLPFQLSSYAILAPYNRYMEDSAKLVSARSRLDHLLDDKDVAMEPLSWELVKSNFAPRGPLNLKTIPIVDIIERLNGSSDYPIDLTKETSSYAEDPLELLRQIPMKYLHFPEDERPAYYGTYTKPQGSREAVRLAKNPFSRTLQETDYDYDSEAEWEAPGEGEDLDSEGDDDLDEEGDDDMDGFLDDEGDAQIKRGLINGDLEPISTGLCWEDSSGVSRLNDGSGAICTDFKDFRMGFLLEPQPHSIDPFSAAYWAPEPTPAVVLKKEGTIDGLMQPPRMPLAQRPANGMLNTLNSSAPVASGTAARASKSLKRQIPADQLSAFKAEVQGSDLTKLALVEALKKKFPKLPKDAINNTLSTIAARVGAKEAEKRWVLL